MSRVCPYAGECYRNPECELTCQRVQEKAVDCWYFMHSHVTRALKQIETAVEAGATTEEIVADLQALRFRVRRTI